MKKIRLGLILATSPLLSESYFSPLGLGYITSSLHEKLPELDVKIYESIDSLLYDKPDCIGISASTENFSLALEYVKKIQESLVSPIILGGVHISLLPESLPPKTIGCIGEGEETVRELMKLFLKENALPAEKLVAISGIIFWNSENILIKTPLRELINPLDSLPFPDRIALGIKGHVDNLYIFTSRGCPYTCKFCVSRIHWNKYREFSAEYVINEMEHLIKTYRVKRITIFDDLFIVNKKRLREIVQKFCEKKWDVEIFCAVRANLVDEEVCLLLKKMNVSEVTFGAESFSEPVLKELKCGSVTVQENKNAIELLSHHGIMVNCSLIFNSPEQTKDDMIETWKTVFGYIKSKKLNKVGWGFLRPYPGSAYWDLALEKGIVSLDMDWALFKKAEMMNLNDHLPKEELYLLMDEWDTKCCLLNPTYRDAPQNFTEKSQIFIKKEFIISKILARENKDESDLFVEKEYKKFLNTLKKHKLILFEGWVLPDKDGNCWIQKTATFSISSSVFNEYDYINLVFFIPDINYYNQKKMVISMKIDKIERQIEVDSNGFHTLSIPIPLLFKIIQKPYANGKIQCSEDFIPSAKYISTDNRSLSVLIIKFELAQSVPENVTNFIQLKETNSLLSN